MISKETCKVLTSMLILPKFGAYEAIMGAVKSAAWCGFTDDEYCPTTLNDEIDWMVIDMGASRAFLKRHREDLDKVFAYFYHVGWCWGIAGVTHNMFNNNIGKAIDDVLS